MRRQLFKRVVLVMLFLILFITSVVPKAYAKDVYSGPMVGFMMSPMNEKVTLKPGDSHSGSFWIMNPEQNTVLVRYGLSVQSFYRDDDGKAIFEDVEGRGQLAKWITIENPDTNTLAPGESDEIKYTIKVPYNVPAGGQYAAITATSLSSEADEPNSAALKESIAMAYTIFVEVDGKTIRSSEITNLSAPNFLFDGDITVSSIVANTGNVHGTATYILEVYSPFSGTPIYSNADEPEKKLILPDRKLAHETTYKDTPPIGIFNIAYTVKFEDGSQKELRKVIFKIPLWLVFITFVVIVGLIMYILYRLKSHQRPVEE